MITSAVRCRGLPHRPILTASRGRDDLFSRLTASRRIQVTVLDDQGFGREYRVHAHDRDGAEHEWILAGSGLVLGDPIRRPSLAATERVLKHLIDLHGLDEDRAAEVLAELYETDDELAAGDDIGD